MYSQVIHACELSQSMHANLLNDKKEKGELPEGNKSLSLTLSEKDKLINALKNLYYASNKQEQVRLLTIGLQVENGKKYKKSSTALNDKLDDLFRFVQIKVSLLIPRIFVGINHWIPQLLMLLLNSTRKIELAEFRLTSQMFY